MLTVPACFACNQDKAMLDNYFRDVVTADIASYRNPKVRAILEERVRPSVRRNQSLLWRAAATGTRWVPMHTPAGILLGNLPAMPLDGARHNRALSMIIQGLYANSFGKRLPAGCSFDIGRINPALIAENWHGLTQLGCNGPYMIGEDVFFHMYFTVQPDAITIFWLLGFYMSVFYIVTVKAP
jgi:hypothetical protein